MSSVSKSIQSGMLYLVLLTTALVLIAMVLFSNQAKAEGCPEIAATPWWGETTAEKLTAQVDRKYEGDWTPYIKEWQSYAEKARDVMARGKPLQVNAQGLALKDQELARYVKLIEQRIKATRCIADEVIDFRLIEELSNMETAAGGNEELEIRLVE
ncbi:MAG: hypothetical protein HQ513_10640 [Rhodospirillales bacterium]|nr:hypothetical protein [Rhodospirillales bacterium]